MKKILFFSALVISLSSFGQDVKLKKNAILVDDKEWAKYDGCGLFNEECTITKGDAEISLQTVKVNDPTQISASNRDGGVQWFVVKFLGTNKSFELQQSAKSVAKTLYKAEVFAEDGSFNEEAIDKLVEKYGFPYSSQYNRSNPQQTIIIQNQTPAPRTGINIGVGLGR